MSAERGALAGVSRTHEANMRFPMAGWCAGLLSGLLVAAPARAQHFGKHSDTEDSKSEKPTHEATAIGTESDDEHTRTPHRETVSSDEDAVQPTRDDDEGSGGDIGSAIAGFMVELLVRNLVFIVAQSGNHQTASPDGELPAGVISDQRHAAPVSVRMGAQALLLSRQGKGADYFLGVDGRYFGVDARLVRLFLNAEDGASGTDAISVSEVHVAWALVAIPQARLRAEAGISTAHGPDVTFIGPSVGLSFEGCVVGPLDLEARAQATPFPHRQLDGEAGLALHAGGLVLRGGVRGLFLDDAGKMDGVAHRERLFSPYLGLGFTF
ncbi:hypothetical protein DRW03_22590 [Corallococcus sp. H22C18031201]|nr:hypothetical protein DRW03_22590 [Corallococcus sp. H22C18031201]